MSATQLCTQTVCAAQTTKSYAATRATSSLLLVQQGQHNLLGSWRMLALSMSLETFAT
jgi:hypothetical protein